MYAGIRVIPCLSVRLISGRPALKEKETMYHLDYTEKPKQCCYPNARQLPYQISRRPFYTALWQWPEAPANQYGSCT